MEEDERKKKLRAGKEKLAAFRKKKTKRKRQSDVAEGQDDEAVSPIRSDSSLDSSAEYTSSSDVSYASCEDPESDGMSGDEMSGKVDMREILRIKTKLRRAEDRISELEESLMGKQLALDKVVQENTQLKSKSEIKKLEELEAAILNRDDIIKHLTIQLQQGVPTETQQQYRVETENLARQVQLLQSQLQKAGQLLHSQSEKQNMSSQALQDAKNQILNLQDMITEKNTVLNQVSQNLNKFTEEYSALKSMYETVKQKESETNQVVQQLMADAEVMRKQDKQNESVGKSSEDMDDTENKLQALRSELEEMYGLQIVEMKQEVIQQFNLEKESLIKERDTLSAEMAKMKDEYQHVVQQSEEYLREKDNLSDELDKMSEDYERETNRVREFQHKLLEFEGIVNHTSELQQECQLLRVQNDELKNKINCQQDSVVGLKAELEILAKENVRFKDQVACLTQELDKQCSENSVADHEKTKLSEQIFSLNNELTVARQENKTNMDKVESMKDVIHSLRSELESSEKEKEELAQKCEDISKSVQVECEKRDQKIEQLKHQLEKKLDRTVGNSDISTDSQVWEDSDTLTESKIDSCHRNSVDLLTSQEQQVLDIIDKVLDVDENVCETESVAPLRDPHVLPTNNIFIETDIIVPETDISVCESNHLFPENDSKLSVSDNKICNTNTLNSETDFKLLESSQVEEQRDRVCMTSETDIFSQPESSVNRDIIEPLAEISEIHFHSSTIHSDSFDDKDSGVISESLTFDLDGENLKVTECELKPIGTEHFQSRLQQVTNENESLKLNIKMLNEQIQVMNTELELLKEDRQKLQVELDAFKHEKFTSTQQHSEESKFEPETTNENKKGQNENVHVKKITSPEMESIDEKLDNLLEENVELRKNLTDVSIELEKVRSEDDSVLEKSELEDQIHKMELKISNYIAGEASLLQENEQLKELNSELQLQVDELQVCVNDLKLLKFEIDETVEVKERDFQKMVEEQMVEHEEFDSEKEELLKKIREMKKELDQLSVCEQNTRDECELLDEKCKILDNEIKDYETKTADLETKNQTLTLKVVDLEKLLNTVKLNERSLSKNDEANMQDLPKEDLLNSKEDLLNKIVDLEAKVESLSLEKADLQEKEIALAIIMEEKSKSDEKMLEKIEELTNTINEKEERLRQTENRYDTEIQMLKNENQELVRSLENDLKNATEREEMLQANVEKFRFEMQTLVDKNEYLSKLVDELQTPGMSLTKDNVEVQLEKKVMAKTVSKCENVYGAVSSPLVVTSNSAIDSYKTDIAEVQKKSARKSLMKQFSKDSLEDRESSAEKEVPTGESCDQVEEESEDVNMIGQSQDRSETETLQKENCELQIKVKELVEKVSEFEKTGEDKQNEIDKLTSENKDVMAILTRKDEIIAETTKEFDMVSLENKKLKEENLHLKMENNKFESMLEGKSSLENQIQGDVEKLKSINDNLKLENAELTENCDSLKSQLVIQSDKLNSYMCSQEKLEKQNTEMTEKISNLQICIDELEKEKGEMNSGLVQLRTNLMEKEKILKEKEDSLECVSKENKQNLIIIGESSNKISQFETDISELVTKLTEKETKFNSMLEKSESICKEKELLETEISSKLAEIVELKEKMEKFDQEYAEMIKGRQLLEEQIIKLENKLDKEQQERESIKMEREKLINEKKDLQVKVEELEEKCKQVKENFEEKLKKEKENFEENLKKQKADFQENMEKQKEVFEEKMKKQKEEFDAKIETYEKLQNDKEELQVKVEELERNHKKDKENFEEIIKKEKENYREQLETQKENLEEKLEKQKEKFTEKMKEDQVDFDARIEKEKKIYKEQLEKHQEKFEELMEKQKEDGEENMKKEKKDFDAKIEMYDRKMIEIVTNGQTIKASCEMMMEEIKKERDVKAEALRLMTESYDLLKQELNDVKRNIQEFEEENQSSRNKIQTLESDLETSQKKVKDLEEKIAFNERLEVYEEESSENDVLHKELNSLKSECEKLRNELNFKADELEVLKDEKSEFQNKVLKLEEENELLGKNKQKLELFQNKIQEIEEENELLRKNRDELESIQQRVQELEEENQLLKENRDELESELGTAAESLQTAVKHRGNSNTEMEDLRKELHALTDIRNELMAQVELLGSNLKDSQKLSEELSQELKKAAGEKDKESSKNKQLVMEKKGLKLKLDKKDNSNGKLQTEVENLKKEISQLLKAKKENSDDLKQKLKSLNEKIIELEEEVKIERKEKIKYLTIAEQYGNIEDELQLERNEKMKYLKSVEELTLQHEEMLKKCKELEETVQLEQSKRKDIERQYQILVEDIEALKLKRDDLLETKQEMADCLQDLQSKYEDVRSLMEGTQKDYEKEISDLQTKLSNVGDNFKCLTSVVDSLENDLKEKNEENKKLMSSLQQDRDLQESLSVEQEHQNTLTVKNQKDHKNRTMMSTPQNETELLETEVQTDIDFTAMEGLIQNASNDSGFLVVEDNLQCHEVHGLESLLPQISQSVSENGSSIEHTSKNTVNEVETDAHPSAESENTVCSSDQIAENVVMTERSITAFQSKTIQEEQSSIQTFNPDTVEAGKSSVPAFCSDTAEYISIPAFRSDTAELEDEQILSRRGPNHEVHVPIQQDQVLEKTHENQQSSLSLDEMQQKLLEEKQDIEDKMKETLKHKEYDLQEKYELMFRDKQAEIMVHYDKEKKDYQKEMEQILKHKVETVKAEKDQAFVKSLQRMRKDFDKKHRREMEKLRMKLLQEIAEGDGTEMEEEIREVVQKLNMENQELAEARDALLQQVNQLSHYRHEQLQQDLNLSIGQHGVTTDESSPKQENTQDEPLIQNRHQYRSQSLMLDWEFSPHSSFDYDGEGFDELKGDSDEDICLRPECQVLRHRLQVISEHLIEGFKPERSGSPESSCELNSQEHGQGFKPEDDFLSASSNNEFVTTPTTELESSFVREALRMEAESAKKRLESTKSVVDDVFVSSPTENIESQNRNSLKQDVRSSSPDPIVIKEGFISDSSNQNTPTNSPLRRSLSNQEDGFIAESDMSKLQDIGRRFRERMSSQEKKEQFIEDTKTHQNLSLSGDAFIAESESKSANVFNIQKPDIKRSKSVSLAKIKISSADRNIPTEEKLATSGSEAFAIEDTFIAESAATNNADNSENETKKSSNIMGKFSDVKISLSKGSNYAPGEEAINYLKTGDTHFIGEGFVSSEIRKVKNELDNFSAVPKNTDCSKKISESSDTKNDLQDTEKENSLLKQEKSKLESKVMDILKMYNKEKNELMDECNRIKIKLENESLCRQQLEQELLEFNEDFEKTGQDDDDENLGKEDRWNSKSEGMSKVSSGFQIMQDIVKEKDKIISEYDKKLHRSFESLENSEKKCDELEKLVGSLEEIVKDKEEEIKEIKEEMSKKVVNVSVSNEYSVMNFEDHEGSVNKSLTDKCVGIESPHYKRTEFAEDISEKFKKQVLTLQHELEMKNKLIEELSLNGDIEMKILKQKIVEFEKLLADKDHYIGKLEEELEHLTKMVNDQFDFVDYRAKMEQSLKEKEKYIKTLEEHFLKHDTFDSSVGSVKRTSPVRTSSPSQAGHISFQDSGIGRQEHKTPNTRNQFPDVDFWNFSTSSTVSAQRSLFRSSGSHYGSSDQQSLSSYSSSSGDQEQIRSGLGPEEDGHYALELKHFKLVDEISGLRHELRETKAIYNKENSLLQEALEKEKMRKDLNNSLSPKSESYSEDQSMQIDELKQNISVLQESNHMLQVENDKWLKRIQEQECIVLELQAQTTSEVDDGRIEKIYGHQIKQLQNQRNDLMERMREINTENTKLSFQLGEKAILEETLRREKDLLKAKLSEKEDIEKELRDKTVELEKQIKAQVKLEEILDHKNQVEKELMRQKRMLELELSEIECKLREKEELLQMQKDDLMREMREKDSSQVSSLCSSRSDLTSEASSYASSVLSTQSSPAHMGRLDSMLDRARKQHTYAVDSLKHLLKSEQEPHDTRSRDRHKPSLSALRSQHFHKVPRK